MMEVKLIAKRFNELRVRNNYSQKLMANYLKVDQSYISKCEKGERNFSIDILEKAAELFGCDIEYFLNESSVLVDMPLAFRAKNLKVDDLETLAAIRKIALNVKFMEKMLEEE